MDMSAVNHEARAFSVAEFCARYGISRTHAYSEMKHGRLHSKKSGKRTLISCSDAEDWLASLPTAGNFASVAPERRAEAANA